MKPTVEELRAALARELERAHGDTSAPAVRNLQADLEELTGERPWAEWL
jgi:hypothetical protein